MTATIRQSLHDGGVVARRNLIKIRRNPELRSISARKRSLS